MNIPLYTIFCPLMTKALIWKKKKTVDSLIQGGLSFFFQFPAFVTESLGVG